MPRELAPRTTPEQEQGIASRLGGMALGGISAVGNLLDVPGSMVRDTLAFRNPLDQLLSPFSPDNRTTGRDLLRKHGVVGKEDTWSNFIPGMAAEIALDPLTYISPALIAKGISGLSKGGRVAHALGLMDSSMPVAQAKALRGANPIDDVAKNVLKPPPPDVPPTSGLGGGPPTPPPAPIAPAPITPSPVVPTPSPVVPPVADDAPFAGPTTTQKMANPVLEPPGQVTGLPSGNSPVQAPKQPGIANQEPQAISKPDVSTFIPKASKKLLGDVQNSIDDMIADPAFMADNPGITHNDLIKIALDDIIDLGDDMGGHLETGISPVYKKPDGTIDEIAMQRQAQNTIAVKQQQKEWKKLKKEAQKARASLDVPEQDLMDAQGGAKAAEPLVPSLPADPQTRSLVGGIQNVMENLKNDIASGAADLTPNDIALTGLWEDYRKLGKKIDAAYKTASKATTPEELAKIQENIAGLKKQQLEFRDKIKAAEDADSAVEPVVEQVAKQQQELGLVGDAAEQLGVPTPAAAELPPSTLPLRGSAIDDVGQATPVPPKAPPVEPPTTPPTGTPTPPPPPTPPVATAAIPPEPQNPIKAAVQRYIGPREARLTNTLNDLVEHKISSELGDIPRKGGKIDLEAIAKQDNLPAQTFVKNLQHYAKTNGFESASDLLDKVGGEKLGGLGGIGLPFTGEMTPIWKGEKSLKVAKVLDATGKYVGDSGLGRAAKALFHAPAGDLWTKEGQQLSELAHGKKRLETVASRTRWREAVKGLADLHETWNETFKGNDPMLMKSMNDVAELVRLTGESKMDTKKALGLYSDINKRGFGEVPQALHDKITEVAGRIVKNQDELRDDLVNSGIHIGEIMDTESASYLARSVGIESLGDKLAHQAKVQERTAKRLSLDADVMESRSELTKNIPTAIVEDIARNYKGKSSDIMKKYGDYLMDQPEYDAIKEGRLSVPDYIKSDGLKQTVRAIYEAGKVNTNELKASLQKVFAKNLEPWDDKYLKEIIDGQRTLPNYVQGKLRGQVDSLIETKGVNHQNVLEDIRQAQANALGAVANRFPKGVKKAFDDGEKLYEELPITLGKNYHQLHRVRASRDAILEFFAQPHSGENTVPLLELGKDGKATGALKAAGFDDPVSALKKFAQHNGISEEAAAKMSVPTSWVAAAKSTMDVVKYPQHETMLRTVASSITKMMKENLTILFPAFHGRNLGSGVAGMNVMMGDVIHTPADGKMYLDSLRRSYDMLKDPKNPKYAEAMKEIFDNDIPHYGHVMADVDISTSQATGDMTPVSPFNLDAAKRKAIRSVAKGQWKHMPESLGLPGDVGQSVTEGLSKAGALADRARVLHRTGLEVGGQTAANIEWINRVSLYDYLRQKGWTPEMAAQKVREVHVDYGDVTPFERNVKLAIPFYTFSRKMLGQTLHGLAESPGGAMATAIKVSNRSRKPSELTPDYVAETTSIPLGESEDGTKRYITGLGMPWEDPLSFFGKGIRGTGLELMSRMNPLVKGPMEYASGTSFFQSTPEGGRPLGDQDPLLGRLAANVTGSKDAYKFGELTEAALANSPATRYLSTARQLTDPRKDILSKAINMLTGVRITDVSPASQDALLRERVSKALKDVGGRQFVRTYIPEYAKENMTPAEIKEAEEYQGVLNTLADRAKQRKKELQAK